MSKLIFSIYSIIAILLLSSLIFVGNFYENNFLPFGFANLIIVLVGAIYLLINKIDLQNKVSTAILAVGSFCGSISLILFTNSILLPFATLISTILLYFYSNNYLANWVKEKLDAKKFVEDLKLKNSVVLGWDVPLIINRVFHLIVSSIIFLVIILNFTLISQEFRSMGEWLIAESTEINILTRLSIDLFYVVIIQIFVIGLLGALKIFRISEVLSREFLAKYKSIIFICINTALVLYLFVTFNCELFGNTQCIISNELNLFRYPSVIQLAVLIFSNLLYGRALNSRNIDATQKFDKYLHIISLLITFVYLVISSVHLSMTISDFGISLVRYIVVAYLLMAFLFIVLSVYSLINKQNLYKLFLSISILSIILLYALPNNEIFFRMNYFLAEKSIIKVYDPLYPYFNSEEIWYMTPADIDKLEKINIIKEYCKKPFFKENFEKKYPKLLICL